MIRPAPSSAPTPSSPPRRAPRAGIAVGLVRRVGAAGAALGATAALAASPAPDGDAAQALPALAWAVGAALLALAAGIGATIARRRSRAPAPPASAAPPARTVSATERTVLLDPVDAETHAAMDRLSATVRSHDLGGDVSDRASDRVSGRAPGRGPARPSRDPDVVAGDPYPKKAPAGLPDIRPPARLLTSAELDAAPRTELREQVRVVSAHNAKLHKVVIAQQASLENARHSIAHHRSAARHARDEARTALEHKRVAVKLARRERAERIRVTDAHEKSEAALSNAMALLRSGRDAVDGGAGDEPVGSDAPERAGTDGERDGTDPAARRARRRFGG